MCFANPFWQAPYIQNLKRNIKEGITSRKSRNVSPAPSPPATRPMISAPTSFYKDESRDARITMTQLTDGHDSFVQSSKSSQMSSSAPSFITASVTGGSIDHDRTAADAERPSPLSPLPIEKAPPLSMSSPIQTTGPEFKTLDLGSPSDDVFTDGSRPLLDPGAGAGGFVDGLQLKGPRVSMMFKGMPFLRDLEDAGDKGEGKGNRVEGTGKRRSLFAGLR